MRLPQLSSENKTVTASQRSFCHLSLISLTVIWDVKLKVSIWKYTIELITMTHAFKIVICHFLVHGPHFWDSRYVLFAIHVVQDTKLSSSNV